MITYLYQFSLNIYKAIWHDTNVVLKIIKASKASDEIANREMLMEESILLRLQVKKKAIHII